MFEQFLSLIRGGTMTDVRTKNRKGPSGWVLVLVISTLTTELGGCQRDDEVTRDLLNARQAEWTSDLGALGSEQAALSARFGRLPNSGALGKGDESLASRRAALLLASTRQSLFDIELHQRQIGPRVEAALSRDPAAAKRLLNDDTIEMATSLQEIRERTTRLEREVGALAREAGDREKNLKAAADTSPASNRQR
jgi:hypothetical protein